MMLIGGVGAVETLRSTVLRPLLDARPELEMEYLLADSWEDLYHRLRISTAAGQPPDVARIKDYWTPEFAGLGTLTALDPRLKQDGIDPLRRYGAQRWAACAGGADGGGGQGRGWALPFTSFLLHPFYNAELLLRAGLTDGEGAPLAPQSWAELRIFARALTDSGRRQYGFSHYSTTAKNQGSVLGWLDYLFQNGGAFADGSGRLAFSSDQGVEALQFMADLIWADGASPEPGQPSPIPGHRVGIWEALSADVLTYRQQGNLDFGVFLKPAKQSRTATLQGNNLALFREARAPEAAWAVLRQLAQPESDLSWSLSSSYLPVALENCDRGPYAGDAVFQTVRAQATRPDTRLLPMLSGFQEMTTVIGAELVAAFTREKTPRDALDDAQRAATAIRNDYAPPERGGSGGRSRIVAAASAAQTHGEPAGWARVRDQIWAGGPNPKLGLVQAPDIFKRNSGGFRLAQDGLVRVRVPAAMVTQGDEAWQPARYESVWWMQMLERLGVPYKVVLELSRRASPEEHAAHAARLLRWATPGTVIVGNEENAVEAQPGADAAGAVERYIDRYAAVQAAVRAAAPGVRIQLYGEAYYGEPDDPRAFLRRVLAGMRAGGLPAPDSAGIHVYDYAEMIAPRVAGYRRLLADFGLAIPVSVEELGPRQGVIDAADEVSFAAASPRDAASAPAGGSRLDELRRQGWLLESEHAELVAQHLAVAVASADQAQIFCAQDFNDELAARRGLVSQSRSGAPDRARPALDSFRFMQRLLNDLVEARYLSPVETGGAAGAQVTRHDGWQAQIWWTPAGAASSLQVHVPAGAYICDARGAALAGPAAVASTLTLPPATSGDAGGAVRVLLVPSR